MIISDKNTTDLKRIIEGIKPMHKHPSPNEVLEYAGPAYIGTKNAKYMIFYPNIVHCYHNTWTIQR